MLASNRPGKGCQGRSVAQTRPSWRSALRARLSPPGWGEGAAGGLRTACGRNLLSRSALAALAGGKFPRPRPLTAAAPARLLALLACRAAPAGGCTLSSEGAQTGSRATRATAAPGRPSPFSP